jgi:hypothetical protein
VAEHLPGMHTALGSIPQRKRKKKALSNGPGQRHSDVVAGVTEHHVVPSVRGGRQARPEAGAEVLSKLKTVTALCCPVLQYSQASTSQLTSFPGVLTQKLVGLGGKKDTPPREPQIQAQGRNTWDLWGAHILSEHT